MTPVRTVMAVGVLVAVGSPGLAAEPIVLPGWSAENTGTDGRAAIVPATGRVRATPGAGLRGPGATCSDGSGIGVDTALGELSAGFSILTGDTAGNGRGICGYAFFGTPLGERPEAGDEDIYSFTVSQPSRASISIFADSENTNFYLLSGLFLFESEDILGDGTLFGAVADDAIGFTDADGPLLNVLGEHEVLEPGTTYYLVVDTQPEGANGAYDIDLVLDSETPFECPSSGVDEGEPVCGDGYVDVFNGGCNAGMPAFTPIGPGETICGSTGTFDGGAVTDEDWYSFTLDDPASVRFEFVGEFGGAFGLIAQHDPGVPGCGNVAGGFDPAVFFSPGSEVAFEHSLEPGTYYVAVDPGFGTPCGSEYALSVELLSVEIECVPYATDEGEGDCSDGFVDDYNGGCNSVPEVFSPLSVNEVVCGTTGTFDGGTLRDTDWYEIVLDRTQTVTLRGTAESPYLLGFIDQTLPGVPGCDNVNPGVDPFVLGDPGETSMIETTLDAGTYYVFVAPQAGASVPCGSAYTLSVEDDSVCSDGSGLVVDADLGVLVQSDTVVAGDTRLEARGLCAYSEPGGMLGGPQPGGEFVAVFEVGRPSVAAVGVVESTGGQAYYLLGGAEVTPDADIFGDGSLYGDEAVDAVGFADTDGPLLNGSGERETLLPGRPYYFVVDTSGADGPFDLDLIIDSGCGPVDFALPFGTLDLADIVAWINLFQSGDPSVDLAVPFGLLDLADIVAWIAEFTGGCR